MTNQPAVEDTEFGEAAYFVNLTFDHALNDADIAAIARQSDAVYSVRLPAAVASGYARAADRGFHISSTPAVGSLLSVLSAAVPRNGRILELGTGVGVGLGWITHGLRFRADAEVTTVELQHDLAELVTRLDLPPWVSVMEGDGLQLVGSLGLFDLIFVDTLGVETYDVSPFVAALAQGGILVIDDAIHTPNESTERRARLDVVRHQLFSDPEVCCTELRISSGVVLVARCDRGQPPA